MRRLVLLALALGCDDPAVGAKALDVLEHGLVAAQVRCDCASPAPNHPEYSAQKLIDGSCVVSEESLVKIYHERNEPGAAICEMYSGHVENGILVIHVGHDDPSPQTFDIETCCSGFNFEAFGVAP